MELLREIIDEIDSQRWQLTNPRQVLLVGDAGMGKSHLLADIAQHHIDRGWPALLVLGGTLSQELGLGSGLDSRPAQKRASPGVASYPRFVSDIGWPVVCF